ncbi:MULTISPECIES: hypothetical protein [unclassified Streptomyces]|uniref:hypothetical protein n=1 Tax=unclassified Streptomyces TaxID=2593676 RepID=UPI003D8E6FD2
MDTIPEPARPWRPEDGRQPVVWTWPRSDPPALWVRSGGAWRYATVMARQDWADGSVVYLQRAGTPLTQGVRDEAGALLVHPAVRDVLRELVRGTRLVPVSESGQLSARPGTANDGSHPVSRHGFAGPLVFRLGIVRV